MSGVLQRRLKVEESCLRAHEPAGSIASLCGGLELDLDHWPVHEQGADRENVCAFQPVTGQAGILAFRVRMAALLAKGRTISYVWLAVPVESADAVFAGLESPSFWPPARCMCKFRAPSIRTQDSGTLQAYSSRTGLT
jgi:hypothetical protein